MVEERYWSDVEFILAKRHDKGDDFWATPDKKLNIGSPFTTLSCVHLLAELGVDPRDPVLKGAADLLWSTWHEDGRFRISPRGAIYPCYTINATNALCHLGYASDGRLRRTFDHLLDIQYHDGGWRCNEFSFGFGPETESSNPGTTLTALNAFRFTDRLNSEKALYKAAEFLLGHWVTRKPLGPCHYGIGTLFMQVEYPFSNYNLFPYVYVLSFYRRAREDERFLDALGVLESKLVNGQIVVERINGKLSELEFCKKGQPTELGTWRYHEILRNLGRQ